MGASGKNDPKLSFDTTFYFGLLAINDKGYAENSRLTNSTFLKKIRGKKLNTQRYTSKVQDKRNLSKKPGQISKLGVPGRSFKIYKFEVTQSTG